MWIQNYKTFKGLDIVVIVMFLAHEWRNAVLYTIWLKFEQQLLASVLIFTQRR